MSFLLAFLTFEIIFKKSTKQKNFLDGETFSLNAKKLSVQVGHWLLLQSDNRKVELDAFMDWWSTILPDETPHSLAALG